MVKVNPSEIFVGIQIHVLCIFNKLHKDLKSCCVFCMVHLQGI